jgi:hypothetical protein
VTFEVTGALANGIFQVAGAGLRIWAAEDVDEVLAAQGLWRELPAAEGLPVAGKGGLENGPRVEFGFNSRGKEFDGLLDVAESAGEQRRGMRTDLISILWTVSPFQGRIAAQDGFKGEAQ